MTRGPEDLKGTSAPSAATSAPATPSTSEWTRCWRCGREVMRSAAACPSCAAPRRRAADVKRRGAPEVSSIPGVMIVFGLMLLTSLVFGFLTSFGLGSQDARDELGTMLVLEFFDAVLVAVAVWKLGRPPRWPRLVQTPAPLVWMVAFVGLLLVLGVNSSYHHLLHAYLRVTPDHRTVARTMGMTPAVILAHCAQPALVEELFFRYLLLDNLRRAMPVHAAVWVSSLLFGLAHIGVPLSIPVLIVVGLGLGYARVLSGRLELPMALHFLHNGIILVLG